MTTTEKILENARKFSFSIKEYSDKERFEMFLYHKSLIDLYYKNASVEYLLSLDMVDVLDFYSFVSPTLAMVLPNSPSGPDISDELEDNDFFVLRETLCTLVKCIKAILAKVEHHLFSVIQEKGIKQEIDDIDTDLRKFHLTNYLEFGGNCIVQGVSSEIEVSQLVKKVMDYRKELVYLLGEDIQCERGSSNRFTPELKRSELAVAGSNTVNKLKCNLPPAAAAFLLMELTGRGYFEKPSNSNNKDAEFYLSILDIQTTRATLAKELSSAANSLGPDKSRLLLLPDISKIL